MTTSHRDLAQPDPWTHSLERSLHRRAITPQVRRSLARRRRASVALSTLMVAGPTGSLLAAAGFGVGGRGVDVAQASPANRAIDSGATPAAMAFELGDRGTPIAEIQRQLGLAADGIFGPLTHAAVTDFQARSGLAVDGIVGPVTWTALFGLEQAAAAAGAGDGGVAVILRERGTAGTAPGSQPGIDPGELPAIGGGDAPDDASAPGGAGDGDQPAIGPVPAPQTKPVSTPAPGGSACGSLRLSSPVDGSVSSGFGPRWGRNHDGVDIAAPTGTPIRAAECGVVSFAGVQSGYGNMVCVKHSSRFETCYAHMTRDTVSQGQRVERGQVIGYVGCTGNCTGPHLHFETRVDGAARDPRPYLGGGAVPGEPTVKAATKAQLTASIRKDVAKARVTATTTLSQTAAPQPAPTYEPPVAPAAAQEPAYVPPVEEPAYTAPAEPVYEAAPTPTPEPVAPAPPVEAAPAPPATPTPPPVAEPPVAQVETPAGAVTATPDPAATAPPVEPPPVEVPPVDAPPTPAPTPPPAP